MLNVMKNDVLWFHQICFILFSEEQVTYMSALTVQNILY